MTSQSNDLYNRNVGGRLKLKGLKSKGLRSKTNTTDSATSTEKSKVNIKYKTIEGTGRIVSSGNTIQGFATKFVDEVAVGDTIVVNHPMSKSNEERTVQAILSNRTLCLDDPFSNDLITTSVFTIRKPEDDPGTAANVSASKSPTKKTSLITVREKTGMWSYKTTTKVVDTQMSAEDRLNERVKHSRDKYCW
ncbi:hypothetical protein BBOV_II004600 [Babesia bovis T2Bo]|uniref:Uncharacterized protein n=1 Tax=Babesia bovis TaxID=5865 RepID=A7AU04_BABBO|nr:hypothetical protein BBOV_II004600 [Babesia bovis T2Bo]EDO06415.1 hypothetical protein BBOV_II004600 [Babesia bovis T2Bo]BAN65089.1 hypothetical protein [Babesia bovis]|eukprot:XP_001609983.1 hypothetical protein [Babesia bovis T2Bo]